MTLSFSNISEADAKQERRGYIDRGRIVSLIAYNPETQMFVFDVY